MKTPGRLISLVACSALVACLLGGCRKFSPWEVYRTEIPKPMPAMGTKTPVADRNAIARDKSASSHVL